MFVPPSQGSPRPNGPRKGPQEQGFPAKRCALLCLLVVWPTAYVLLQALGLCGTCWEGCSGPDASGVPGRPGEESEWFACAV